MFLLAGLQLWGWWCAWLFRLVSFVLVDGVVFGWFGVRV